PAMQHVGEAQVLDVSGAAGDLGRNVEPCAAGADELVLLRWLRRNLRGGFAMKCGLRAELPISDLPIRGTDGDRAVVYGHLEVERLARQTEMREREIEQDAARLGAGVMQCSPAIFDRLAAGGEAFIGR